MESIYENVQPGQIIEVPDFRAKIWVDQKIAEQVPDSTPTTARLNAGLSDSEPRYAHY